MRSAYIKNSHQNPKYPQPTSAKKEQIPPKSRIPNPKLKKQGEIPTYLQLQLSRTQLHRIAANSSRTVRI